MPLYRLEGIVLASRPFGEADRLVTLLTRERGKHRAVARGARRPRSTLAAGVQPFTRGSYLLWRGRQLDGISQCEVLEGFRPLREELERMLHAAAACELVEALAREGDAVPEVYGLLGEGLRLLAAAEPGRLGAVLVAFQWQLLARCGFRPELETCTGCGAPVPPGPARFVPRSGGVVCPACDPGGGVALTAAARAAVGFALRGPLAAAARVQLPEGDWRALTAAAAAYAQEVLERPLRSGPLLEMLREVRGDPA